MHFVLVRCSFWHFSCVQTREAMAIKPDEHAGSIPSTTALSIGYYCREPLTSYSARVLLQAIHLRGECQDRSHLTKCEYSLMVPLQTENKLWESRCIERSGVFWSSAGSCIAGVGLLLQSGGAALQERCSQQRSPQDLASASHAA